jgi:putative NADH-flavin reductase
MKLAIFGATGGTGRELVKQALEQGHFVTAFVRDVARLPVIHPQLRIEQGNVLNAAQVELAVKGSAAVISALGVSAKTPANVISEGLANIISAMQRYGIKRLMLESAFGVAGANQGFYGHFLNLAIRQRLADKQKAENMLKRSRLDWTAVRPVALTNGPLTGRYRAGEGLKVPFWWPTISRADVADFMLKSLSDNTFFRQTPTISRW